MNPVYIVLIIILVIFLIYLFIDLTYNKFKYYIIRINKVQEEIDTILNNKYENIIKIDSIIKDKIKTEKDIIDDISSIKDENKDRTELDKILSDSLEKIEYIKEQYNELDNETELNNLFNSIKTDEESRNAYKEFYNDNVNDYNRIVSMFPFVITAKLFKYKKKEFFNNKE